MTSQSKIALAVRQSDVQRIVDFLLKDNAFIRKRKRFIAALGLKNADYLTSEIQFTNGNIEIDDFLSVVIELWISKNGTGATWWRLIQVLQNCELKDIEDAVTAHVTHTSNVSTPIAHSVSIQREESTSEETHLIHQQQELSSRGHVLTLQNYPTENSNYVKDSESYPSNQSLERNTNRRNNHQTLRQRMSRFFTSYKKPITYSAAICFFAIGILCFYLALDSAKNSSPQGGAKSSIFQPVTLKPTAITASDTKEESNHNIFNLESQKRHVRNETSPITNEEATTLPYSPATQDSANEMIQSPKYDVMEMFNITSKIVHRTLSEPSSPHNKFCKHKSVSLTVDLDTSAQRNKEHFSAKCKENVNSMEILTPLNQTRLLELLILYNNINQTLRFSGPHVCDSIDHIERSTVNHPLTQVKAERLYFNNIKECIDLYKFLLNSVNFPHLIEVVIQNSVLLERNIENVADLVCRKGNVHSLSCYGRYCDKINQNNIWCLNKLTNLDIVPEGNQPTKSP